MGRRRAERCRQPARDSSTGTPEGPQGLLALLLTLSLKSHTTERVNRRGGPGNAGPLPSPETHAAPAAWLAPSSPTRRTSRRLSDTLLPVPLFLLLALPVGARASGPTRAPNLGGCSSTSPQKPSSPGNPGPKHPSRPAPASLCPRRWPPSPPAPSFWSAAWRAPRRCRPQSAAPMLQRLWSRRSSCRTAGCPRLQAPAAAPAGAGGWQRGAARAAADSGAAAVLLLFLGFGFCDAG